MTTANRLSVFAALAVLSGGNCPAQAPLENAEVRLPYAELRRLIEASTERAEKTPVMPPALLSSRLALAMDDGGVVIDADFELVRFGAEPSRIALIGGDIAVSSSETDGMGLVVHEGMLCQIGASAGKSSVKTMLRLTSAGPSFELIFPPCPGTLLDLTQLPEGLALSLQTGEGEQVYTAGRVIPLPADASRIGLRILDREESREALSPPEPSNWVWQHQALVSPGEGGLAYRLLSHASATEGSALEATLELPMGAREATASGDDLVGVRRGRSERGHPVLHLTWQTRDLMERKVEVGYLMSVRPLDRSWTLRAPVGGQGDEGQVRYFLAASPKLKFVADGLSERLAPDSLPPALARSMTSTSCYLIEGLGEMKVEVTRLPVVSLDDATIEEADWKLGIEPDGSTLVEGTLRVPYRAAEGVVLGVPDGMSLLACRVDDLAVEPIDRGQARIEVPLSPPEAGKEATVLISVAFTAKGEPFEPLEGMTSFKLPDTPLFIRELRWRLDLPPGYSAETNGNLIREARKTSDPASSIRLVKRLCRGEQPEIRVFYQSSNLLP